MDYISYINPFASAPISATSEKKKEDILVEIGSPSKFVDGVRNFLSLPTKLLLWNSSFNSGNISPEIIDKVKEYLHTEGLHDVAVSINQYKPQLIWKRIFTNPKTSLLSKMSLGLATAVIETVAFDKFSGFRGDHYTPSSNTLHLFSNDLSIALHECGHAKDFNSRRNPSLYTLLATTPVVGSVFTVAKEYLASKHAIVYMKDHEHSHHVRDAFKVLTPALATYCTAVVLPNVFQKAMNLISEISIIADVCQEKSLTCEVGVMAFGDKVKQFQDALTITAIGVPAIVLAGHIIGRVLARHYAPAEEKKNAPVEEQKAKIGEEVNANDQSAPTSTQPLSLKEPSPEKT